jgi:hypothetical protein
VQKAHILNFLFQIAWFTANREPPETGPSRSQRPGGNGDLKIPDFFYNNSGIHPISGQSGNYKGQIFPMFGLGASVMFCYKLPDVHRTI